MSLKHLKMFSPKRGHLHKNLKMRGWAMQASALSRLSPNYVLMVCAALMDCSPPGSSVPGILQARILEWVAIPFSRGSSRPRDRTQVSCIAGRFSTIWTNWEAPYNYHTRPQLYPSCETTSFSKSGIISYASCIQPLINIWPSLMAQLVKNLPAMRETWVKIPGVGSSPGEGKGSPLQYSGLENSMNCIVLGVAKSQTQLSDFHSLSLWGLPW